MKRPRPEDYETDHEYKNRMSVYDEHLRHEEWVRNGGKKPFLVWTIIIGGLCGGIIYFALSVFKWLS